MTHLAQVGAPLAMVAVLAGGCGGSDKSRGAETGATSDSALAAKAAAGPRHISNVMIGKRIGSGNRLTEPTFQFAPQDTVYLSVATEGSTGADKITTAWRSQTGEVLQQPTEPIKAGENTAFQLSQPKGLKPGTYKVIVFLGSDSADTKVFVVKK